jgi:hypothetical protein
MKAQIKIYTIFITIGITLFFSCTKDFEDMNKDPHGFTTASDGSLFNAFVESLVLTGDEQFYINNEILYKQTQLAALTNDAWGSYTLGTESMWSNYYLILPNVRELESRFSVLPDSGEVKNMKAMVKIILAYKTFKLTDIFGDIPFFNAGYGFQNLEYLHPKYDTQRDIYLFLLDELKWADENIDESATSEEPFKTFKAFDKLFKGDMLQWRKLANSLRLRYAMRMSEKEPVLAGEIIKEIIESNRPVFYGYDFITPKLESACLWPAEMGFKNTSLNWSFREHENLRMGSNIWHQLSAHDSIDGSGIFDPRAYIFFEGNNENEWIPYPQFPDNTTPPSAGIPYEEHRDAAGNYSIKGDCYYSPFNYFVIRDEDFMPIIMITGAEVHFIKSEAYFRGIGVAEDKAQAEIEYFNGINSSVEWWVGVANNLKLPVSGLTFPQMITIPSNLGSFSVQGYFGFWNATSEEEKLEFIYTQRWLDAFRQPWEAYALARQTGKTPREGNAISHYRMPYPPSEVEYNSAEWSKAISNQGGDSPDVKIWWIP